MAKELEGWFALERDCAIWDRRESARQFMAALREGEDAAPSGVTYGARVYGGCLEPGYRLTSKRRTTECPECGRWRLFRHDWEAAEGGSLNYYYSEECAACGHFETNGDW